MKNLLMLKRIIRATMLLSVGIWFGISVTSYREDISFVISLVAFFLMGICACTTIWLNHRDQKREKLEKQQRTSES